MLNNMLGEQDLNPAGFHRWPVDRRMSSMMAPTVLFLPNQQTVALGSGGSNRIRSALLQVVVNLIDFDMSLDAAVDAPRIHYEAGHLSIEGGFAQETLDPICSAFADHQCWQARNLFFGGVHSVARTEEGFFGVGDPRRGGVSVGVGQGIKKGCAD